MTRGFEQQDTLANRVFTRYAPTPHQVGVKLVEPPPAPKHGDKRPLEPRAF